MTPRLHAYSICDRIFNASWKNCVWKKPTELINYHIIILMSSSRHSSVIVVCVDKNICPQKHRSRLFIERKQHNNNIVCGHCTTTCTHATIILDMQLHSSNQKHIMWNRAVHFVERQPKVKLLFFVTLSRTPLPAVLIILLLFACFVWPRRRRPFYCN